jgi:hypothetical protein
MSTKSEITLLLKITQNNAQAIPEILKGLRRVGFEKLEQGFKGDRKATEDLAVVNRSISAVKKLRSNLDILKK